MNIQIFDSLVEYEQSKSEPERSEITLVRPKANIQLRDYQQEAYDAIIRDVTNGYRSVLCVLATGLGKTVLFSKIIEEWNGRVLVLVHLEELLQNAVSEIGKITGEIIGIERQSEHQEGERVVVSIVQSLINRLRNFPRDYFSLIIIDECFPAGQLVDGKPIELIEVGDEVNSYNHELGVIEKRTVTYKFDRNSVSSILRLRHLNGVIECTDNHPIFTLELGYVRASSVTVGMHCLWGDFRGTEILRKQTETLFGEGMPLKTQFTNNVKYEQGSRIRQDEEKEPYAFRIFSKEDGGDSYEDRSFSCSKRREREVSDSSRVEGAGDCERMVWRVGEPSSCEDHESNGVGSEPLQAGPSKPVIDDLPGNRRAESFGCEQKGAGYEERNLLEFVRVESVEVLKPRGFGETRVFNLEVEGNNNFFVGGTLVHNCHHAASEAYGSILGHFGQAKVIGLTATDGRSDGKSLPFQSCSYRMGIQQGVERGYLVPIRGRRVIIESIDLRRVKVNTVGNFDDESLDDEMVKGAAAIADVICADYAFDKGILFFPGCASAKLTSDFINKSLPGLCVYIDGKITGQERRELVQSLRHGKANWLCNVGIATEGFNWPECSVVGMCSPTLSRSAYVQRAGRGTRTLGGLLDGVLDSIQRKRTISNSSKPYMTILDFVGISANLDLISHESMLSPEPKAKEPSERIERRTEETDERTPGVGKVQLFGREFVSSIASETSHTSEDYDPFERTGGEVGGPELRSSVSTEITEKQYKLLCKFGIDDKLITRGLAQKLIGFAAQRNFRLTNADRELLKIIYHKANVQQ